MRRVSGMTGVLMAKTTASVRCPACGRPVEWSQRSHYRPFCSQRCKLIDLGAWLDGSHRIPGSELDEDSPDSPGDEDDDSER